MEVFQAIECNNPEKVLKICTRGADLEAVDNYGNTPLLKACYLGYFKIVNVLLSHRANLRAINYMGQNALTLAVYSGSGETVNLLLRSRSYADFSLSSMIPPLCVAILRGHQHLIHFFWKLEPRPTNIKTVHGLNVAQLQRIYAHRQNNCNLRLRPL